MLTVYGVTLIAAKAKDDAHEVDATVDAYAEVHASG